MTACQQRRLLLPTDHSAKWLDSRAVRYINIDAPVWIFMHSIVRCCFYAFAFRHRRHYIFGLSVRPSVRSLKYPLRACTWVRWSTRPTVTVLRHVRPSVCPSVRPERFPGICRRTHRGNGLEFYMMMYLDHLQNWLVYGHGLLIFLKFWHYFDLVKRVKFGVSGHFLENAWRKWPEILHADVSSQPTGLISLWPRSVDFCNFDTILTSWNGSNLGFPDIFWKTHWGNGLKCRMLIYPDHFQKRLDYGYSL